MIECTTAKKTICEYPQLLCTQCIYATIRKIKQLRNIEIFFCNLDEAKKGKKIKNENFVQEGAKLKLI